MLKGNFEKWGKGIITRNRVEAITYNRSQRLGLILLLGSCRTAVNSVAIILLSIDSQFEVLKLTQNRKCTNLEQLRAMIIVKRLLWIDSTNI